MSDKLPIRTAVLISGSGSNLQALIDASQQVGYPAEIALVISNKPEAYGLVRAANANIPALTIDHKACTSRAAFEQALDIALREADIEIICLAGFMRILTKSFVDKWQGSVMNIHPSLLPLFKGLHVHQQALEAGVSVSGCTVHLVTPDLDDGPVLGQRSVPIRENDTEQSLSTRILAKEHLLYPACLKGFAAQRLNDTTPKA